MPTNAARLSRRSLSDFRRQPKIHPTLTRYFGRAPGVNGSSLERNFGGTCESARRDYLRRRDWQCVTWVDSSAAA